MSRLRFVRYPFLFFISLLMAGTVNAIDEINVVGLFKDRAIVELDGVQRILAPGKPTPEGVVLISANSREAVIEINGIKKTYTLGRHISNRFAGPTGQKTVTIAPDTAGMYFVSGSINDFQVDFVIDTGATYISMNEHQARRLGLDYKMTGKKGVISTASGLGKIYVVKLAKVRVGDIVLNDVQCAIHNGDFPQQVLLGNSFLGRISMKRDGRLLKLEQLY